jgi:hypothetical protein
MLTYLQNTQKQMRLIIIPAAVDDDLYVFVVNAETHIMHYEIFHSRYQRVVIPIQQEK